MTFAEDNVDVQRFSWGRGDFSEFDALRQVHHMMREARRTRETVYLALGRFFRAYHFFNLIRVYGDVPYTDALQGDRYFDPAVGDGVFRPSYEASKKIVLGILDELKTADMELVQSVGDLSGDMIYQGDKMRWRKLINSFRLRVLLSLSNLSNDPDLKPKERFQEIYSASPLFQDSDESAWLRHADQSRLRYGLYRSNKLETGTRMNKDFVDLLQRFKDPRLFKFAEMSSNARKAGLSPTDFNAYKGVDVTLQPSDIQAEVSPGGVSKIHPRYYNDPVNEPYILMGFSSCNSSWPKRHRGGGLQVRLTSFITTASRPALPSMGYQMLIIRGTFSKLK